MLKFVNAIIPTILKNLLFILSQPYKNTNPKQLKTIVPKNGIYKPSASINPLFKP